MAAAATPATPADPAVTAPGNIVLGTQESDTLDGGAGGQTIIGLDGDDLLIGGRDSLASRDINNTIPVADLEDQTESDDGNDALYGGRGNDTIMGGAGSGVNEVLMAHRRAVPVLNIGLPDYFIPQGTQEEIRADLGLDAAGIEAKIRAWLD